MKKKITCAAIVFTFLISFSAVFAQSDDKAEAVRAELIKYHVKSKKSVLQGLTTNLVMSALSFAMADRLTDSNYERRLNISGGISLGFALYGTWQYFNEAKIIKNVQRMDMQNADAIARGLNKSLKWQKLWLYFGLASSAYSTGSLINTAQNFKLAIGKEDHKNDLRNFFYFNAAVSGYSLYDRWKDLKENKEDIQKLHSLMPK